MEPTITITSQYSLHRGAGTDFSDAEEQEQEQEQEQECTKTKKALLWRGLNIQISVQSIYQYTDFIGQYTIYRFQITNIPGF